MTQELPQHRQIHRDTCPNQNHLSISEVDRSHDEQALPIEGLHQGLCDVLTDIEVHLILFHLWCVAEVRQVWSGVAVLAIMDREVEIDLNLIAGHYHRS